MQLRASGSDSAPIHRLTGWHCAATLPSLFYVWTQGMGRLQGRAGRREGSLSNAFRMSLRK